VPFRDRGAIIPIGGRMTNAVASALVSLKGWLATLHRNPVKNLILFSYLLTQSASTNLPCARYPQGPRENNKAAPDASQR
jgi:hypothetical protein